MLLEFFNLSLFLFQEFGLAFLGLFLFLSFQLLTLDSGVESFDYTRIPAHMQNTARLYIEQGIPPGSFLQAVICNDLFGAYRRADDINQAAMRDWVVFFYNEAPGDCWGSVERFSAWIASGGIAGRDAA